MTMTQKLSSCMLQWGAQAFGLLEAQKGGRGQTVFFDLGLRMLRDI
jgi:hypothetical protein